ncbi:MAG: helix-turn-helix domain-containing protein [Gemmatimonadales bacterium]
MEKRKERRLTAAGWRVGSAADFLGLSDAEAALVELRLRLSGALRTRRLARGVSQQALAKRLGSSQSRVAKMEAADPTVTLDLLLRGLLVLGATPRDLARALQRSTRRAAA